MYDISKFKPSLITMGALLATIILTAQFAGAEDNPFKATELPSDYMVSDSGDKHSGDKHSGDKHSDDKHSDDKHSDDKHSDDKHSGDKHSEKES